jgi:hypothetical protein
MKELYNKPELMLDEFKRVDVMTESNPGGTSITEDPEDF